MVELKGIDRVISDIERRNPVKCSSCLGSGTEKLLGFDTPCEHCDGTGKVIFLEVIATVSVPSTTKYNYEVFI